MQLEYCYHTHTSRCGHAIGLDEEYVLSAIKLGIKRLGFSDHVFLPGIIQEGIRGNYSLLDDYLSSINKLKEKYKDQIEILVGFEAEYLPNFVNYYKELLDSQKIDYLILGQHLYSDSNNQLHWFGVADTEKYFSNLIKGIKTGLFSYVAHPDIFMNSHYLFDSQLYDLSKRLLEVCQMYHIPLEINLGGYRAHRRYPCVDFFKLASLYDVEFVIGVDAHSPKDFNEDDLVFLEHFIDITGVKEKVLFNYKLKKVK